MPTSFSGAAAFVFGFWLALQLLLPLVTPRHDGTLGAVLQSAEIEAGPEALFRASDEQ